MALDIVQPGDRFTILTLPYGPLDNQYDLIRKLLDTARTHDLEISLAVADRAFHNSETHTIMEGLNIPFITPCTEYPDIKELFKKVQFPYVENNRFMKGRVLYNIAAIRAEDENGKQIYDKQGNPVYHAYATNIPLDENDAKGSYELLETEYQKRWGIETGFRMKKRSFGLWTTSDNNSIRVFYWLFSVLMYNLWILADILVCLKLYGRVGDFHLVTSKQFRLVFFLIVVDPG